MLGRLCRRAADAQATLAPVARSLVGGRCCWCPRRRRRPQATSGVGAGERVPSSGGDRERAHDEAGRVEGAGRARDDADDERAGEGARLGGDFDQPGRSERSDGDQVAIWMVTRW